MSNDFTIRDSLEVQFTKAPAIAIAGPSGSGKTESAMRLARGWCDYFGENEKFVVLDTEEKRALYKKARHQPWDWLDFQPPFSPERTWAALAAVKHYRAVVLDSTSHEYAGEGGISEIAEDELEKMAKGDPAKMEKLIAPSWKNAKRRHKREFMGNLIRYPTLIICCLRAEPKVKFLKEKFQRQDGSGGEKTVIVDAGYQPICEKMFMYEMLASFMMYAENAGVPEQVKALEEDLKPVFLLGQKIDESTGRRLAAWADARSKETAPKKMPDSARTGGATTITAPPSSSSTAALITAEQKQELERLCAERDVTVSDLCRVGRIATLADLEADAFARAKSWVERHPKPTVDEAAILRKIDAAANRDAAAEVLDSVRDQPFYPKANAAFTNRWNASP